MLSFNFEFINDIGSLHKTCSPTHSHAGEVNAEACRGEAACWKDSSWVTRQKQARHFGSLELLEALGHHLKALRQETAFCRFQPASGGRRERTGWWDRNVDFDYIENVCEDSFPGFFILSPPKHRQRRGQKSRKIKSEGGEKLFPHSDHFLFRQFHRPRSALTKCLSRVKTKPTNAPWGGLPSDSTLNCVFAAFTPKMIDLCFLHIMVWLIWYRFEYILAAMNCFKVSCSGLHNSGLLASKATN